MKVKVKDIPLHTDKYCLKEHTIFNECKAQFVGKEINVMQKDNNWLIYTENDDYLYFFYDWVEYVSG